MSGLNCFQDILAIPCRSDGLESSSRQWGLSTNDPGEGEGIFYYPVTCNPFIALANIIMIGHNCDVVVKKLGTTSCAIDSSDGTYKNKYRVVVIGRN